MSDTEPHNEPPITEPPPPEDPIVMALSRLEGKMDTFISIAQRCFDRLSVVDAKTEELAKNVVNHEARIVLLEQRPTTTILPPASNGASG